MKCRLFVIELLMLMLAVGQLRGQTSTQGQDFWLGFLPNHSLTAQNRCVLAINPAQDGQVTISNEYTGWSHTLPLTANTPTTYQIPATQIFSNPSTTTLSNTAIHVVSTVPIDLVAYNRASTPAAADATLIFPTATLGCHYLVQTYATQSSDLGTTSCSSDFAVVATQDNTTVLVGLSAACANSLSVGNHTFTLQRGQMLTFHADASDDLSGSVVQANRRVAVFMGNMLAKTSSVSADHLYGQAVSTCQLGSTYVAVPAIGHEQDIVKITASASTTVLANEGAGNISTITVGPTSSPTVTISQPTVFQSSGDFLAGQYHTSRLSSAQGADWGDVAYTPLVSTDQWTQCARFQTLTMDTRGSYSPRYYVNLVCLASDQGSMFLDSVPLTGFTTIPGMPYAYLRQQVSAGGHVVYSTAASGFTGFHYGLDENWEAYYSLLGASLDTISYQPDDTVTVHLTGCDSVAYDSQTYRSPGTYRHDFFGGCGHDTVYLIHVDLGHTSDTSLNFFTTERTFSWGGLTFDHAVDTVLHLAGAYGCDSIVRIHLAMSHIDTIRIDTSHCGPMTLYDHYFAHSDSLVVVQFQGEDTLVLMVSCRIYPTYELTQSFELTNDSLYWIDGNWYGRSTDEPVVHYVTAHGCDSVVHLHLVVHSSFSVWVPNAFTPDEEVNSLFRVFSHGIRSMTVLIFNRWGEQVAEFDGLTETWDGTCHGTPCPQGSYVYKVIYDPVEHKESFFPIVGTVTLLR